MEMMFYYFLKSSVDDVQREDPICTDEYLGDIGEFCEIDGVGYIIVDYVEEIHFWDDLISDSVWQ